MTTRHSDRLPVAAALVLCMALQSLAIAGVFYLVLRYTGCAP